MAARWPLRTRLIRASAELGYRPGLAPKALNAALHEAMCGWSAAPPETRVAQPLLGIRQLCLATRVARAVRQPGRHQHQRDVVGVIRPYLRIHVRRKSTSAIAALRREMNGHEQLARAAARA